MRLRLHCKTHDGYADVLERRDIQVDVDMKETRQAQNSPAGVSIIDIDDDTPCSKVTERHPDWKKLTCRYEVQTV